MDKSIKVAGSVVILVTMIVGSVLILQFGFTPIGGVPVPICEIEQGFYCGLKARVNYVIEDNDTWNTLWADMNNISTGYPELPYVNFTSEVIFAVFLGEFATGGYVAEITSIVVSENVVTVYIREQHPGASCGVTMALSQPYHIVKASMDLSLTVEFVYNLVIHNC
jgi:hypothetical protein